MSWSNDEILEEVNRYEAEQKELKHQILKLVWYMRGGVSLEEAYYLSSEERNIIGDIVKDNIETTKKTQLPFF